MSQACVIDLILSGFEWMLGTPLKGSQAKASQLMGPGMKKSSAPGELLVLDSILLF